VKTTKIASRNVMFSTPESANSNVNMGLILGAKRNFIIDTGIGGGCAGAMLKYIGDDSKPVIVVNTHHDWDHVAGNWVFEGSAIVAHKLCHKTMDEKWDDMIQRAKREGMYFDGEPRKRLPNLLFEGSIYFPEDCVSVFHTPGHTEDSVSMYDEIDKVLYTGDNFGVKDGEAHFWGEDLAEFRRLIDCYKQYDFDVCVSGHSEPQAREVLALLEAALAKARAQSGKEL